VTASEQDRLDAALEEWLDRVLAGEALDPAEFARARALPAAQFLPRAEQARWLVGRHERARAEPAGVPAPPFRLGEFDVLAEAGRGGMGIVFRAEQQSLGRTVAIKVLQPALLGSERGRERLLREARAAARLQHPHVVQILAVGEQDGICWYAMEWIDGESLASIVRKRRAAGLHCSAAYAVESSLLLAKVARALAHVHAHGLLHRDVKSANILVDRHGEPHLADFGLVKDAAEATLTGSGEVLGSQPYMSPEQCAGRRLDARSDVYSLGITLYECLALRLPYDSDRLDTLRRRILEGRLPAPRSIDAGIPEPLQWICVQACAREPGERYPGAAGLALDLEAFAAGDDVQARPPSSWLLLRRFAWRTRRALAAAAFLLACAGTAWFVMGLAARAAANELRLVRGQVLEARLAGDQARLQRTLAAACERFPADASLQLTRLSEALADGGGDAAQRAIAAARPVLVRDDQRVVVAAGEAAATWLAGGELPPEQESALQALAALRSQDGETMLAAGRVLIAVRRYPEAVEVLRRVEGADLRVRTLALGGLAYACKRSGRATEARAALSAFALLHETPRILYELLQMSFAAGDSEQAQSDLRLLRERHPGSAWRTAGEVLLGGADARDEAALDRSAAEARAAPDWPQAAPVLGPALYAAHRSAGRLDRALAIITEVVGERPEEPNLRGLLGTTLHELGRRDEGVAELLRAAQCGDRLPGERHAHWGTYYFYAGDLRQAVHHFRESARSAATDPQRLRQLGRALAGAAAASEDQVERKALLRECLAVCEAEAKAAPRSRRPQELLAEALGALADELGPEQAETRDLRRRQKEIDDRLRQR
jgi:hypothetical protein